MYYKDIERKVKVAYAIAREARNKGLDPIDKVEIPLATDLPERVTGLVSTVIPQIKDVRIEKRIRQLEKEYGFLEPIIAFVIADEIASEKFSKFPSKLEAIVAGIRVGFAYLTSGSVSSPLEGFTRLVLKKNENGEFFSAYYSGPVRSAGGTAAALSVVLIDYLRQRFGYAKYEAKEEAIGRTVTEVYDYNDRITNLQYLPSEKELEVLAKNLPVQVTGDATEDLEVSNYKIVEDVETPKVRGGFCLVMAECLAQKSAKVSRLIGDLRKNGLPFDGWDFLDKIVALQKRKKAEGEMETAVYIKDLVAGRPVLGHPSRNGSFRLRYGKTRASGLSSVAVHPALSYLVSEFIAIGTQFRMERPGKSAAITFCDSIEPPIVKLEDGRIMKVKSIEESKKIVNKVKEIIYLGDILISYGDFYNRNHPLLPCGYNEEYWLAEAKEKGISAKGISLEEAIKISEEKKLPLHPSFIFYWQSINLFQLRDLLKWILEGKINGEIVLPLKERQEAKRSLELIGCQHLVIADKVVIKDEAKALLYNLGILGLEMEETKKRIKGVVSKIDDAQGGSLAIINYLCRSKIRDKCGTFIGARMGRPEKAKPRKLTGQPNVLFPVGSQGGRLRSFQEAIKNGKIIADFPIYYCEECEEETIYYVCEKCGKTTKRMSFCNECNQRVDGKCARHGKALLYTVKSIDVKHYMDIAKEKLNFTDVEMPPLIKGVRGTSSASHTVENLAKGILRAAFGLSVNKDGTIRVDLTELPLTHFKPNEVSVGLDKLKELGYTRDVNGKELKDQEQILELKPHDIILPLCPESLNERVVDHFVKVAAFIDNLLVRFYGLRPFYNVKTRDDLVGQLVVALSPHTSVGVVGRIVGFSSIQALYAHPLLHAALRRDCDGDECALMLILDCLINFSHQFLPAHRGSTQDAPLILNARIKATEVDDMVFDIESCKEYPLELYTKAEKFASPREIKVPQIRDLLGGEVKGLQYTHEISNINMGVTCSAYKRIETMNAKVAKQMEVAEKIRAVDENDVARLIIERHFIRDIKGNMRKFSSQQFRCSKCNTKFRRPPLTGNCTNCGGKIIFTVSEGGIVKYLDSALNLAENYDVSAYVRQSLELLKRRIESVFGREKEKQVALKQWLG